LSEANLNLPVPYVVFVHATSRADKQWPDTAWIDLGQSLVRRGASIVLPWGSEEERVTSERLAKEFGGCGHRAAQAVVAGGGWPDRRGRRDSRR
jgi:ADP-heptose:LPS heptosyltransferase